MSLFMTDRFGNRVLNTAINRAAKERAEALLTGVTVTGTRRDVEQPTISGTTKAEEPSTRESIGERKYEETKKVTTFTTFPSDLRELDGRPYVIFYIYDTETAPILSGDGTPEYVENDLRTKSIKQGAEKVIRTAGSAAEVADDQTFGLGSSLTKAGTAVVDEIGQITGVTKEGENLSSVLKDRFKGFSLQRNIDKKTEAIVLFMPDSLMANYEHNYDEISVTATLGTAGMLAQAISDTSGGANRNSDPYILEAASRVAGALPGLQSSEELTNLLVFGTTGRAINPQMEVLYNSPRLRTFTFDFRMIPRSKPEADEVRKIINKFKFYSAPRIEAQTSGRYYIPPSRFVLEFHHRGEENPYLFKTQQCVLESIAIDYAPNGYATHWDGSPVETRLQLIFKETRMLSRADFDSEKIAGALY